MGLKSFQKLAKNSKIAALFFIVLLLVAYDLIGLGGNLRFYSKWIECGARPVVADQTIGFGASVPSYVQGPAFSLLRMTPAQFCSPRNAELAGYSANSQTYTYPHLTDKERECLALIRNSLPFNAEECSEIRIKK